MTPFAKIALTIILFALPVSLSAQTMNTPAKTAILVEVETGATLFAKEPDLTFPPASMSKMMTAYIIFDQIKSGALSLTDTTTVSDTAWRQWAGSEGSLMFLGAGEEVSVEDLIRGIVISSGNDACTVVAEMLAGTEEEFARWMTDKAEEIGMTNSKFQNASGWPAPDQYVTARDLATLAGHIIQEFPELYKYFAETSFTHGTDFQTGAPIKQGNRNPLLYRMPGVADGLKTGHTNEAGYGLTASAAQDGRRLVLVVSGLTSVQERARESERLIRYGLRNFNTYALFDKGQQVDEALVWLGANNAVPLVVSEDVRLTMTRRARSGMKVTLAYDNPIPAPITAGQPLATVTISAPDMEDLIIPLVAGSDVAEIKGFGRIGAAFNYMLFGSSGQ